MELYFIILFAISTVNGFGPPNQGSQELSCFGEYLRSKNLLHELQLDVELKPPTFNDTKPCETFVAVYDQRFYKFLELTLSEDQQLGNITKCLVDVLQHSKLAELVVMSVVSSDESFSRNFERTRLTWKFNLAIEKKIETAWKLCTAKETYGSVFDDYFKNRSGDRSANLSVGDHVDDYCVRKYLVTSNFIDSTVYNIVLNPDDIEVKNINCVERIQGLEQAVIEKFIEQYENTAKLPFESSRSCITDVISRKNYFEPIMRVAVLREINIGEHYGAERKKFILLMRNLYAGVVKC